MSRCDVIAGVICAYNVSRLTVFAHSAEAKCVSRHEIAASRVNGWVDRSKLICRNVVRCRDAVANVACSNCVCARAIRCCHSCWRTKIKIKSWPAIRNLYLQVAKTGRTTAAIAKARANIVGKVGKEWDRKWVTVYRTSLLWSWRWRTEMKKVELGVDEFYLTILALALLDSGLPPKHANYVPVSNQQYEVRKIKYIHMLLILSFVHSTSLIHSPIYARASRKRCAST